MTRPLWPILAALILALAMVPMVARSAVAYPSAVVSHSVSYSVWTIQGSSVHLRFILPRPVVPQLLGRGASSRDQAAIGAAVLDQVAVTSSGGDCPALDQGEGAGRIYTLALTPGVDRFEVIFECPQASGMVLHDGVLFGRAPGHVNYASVQVGAGRPAFELFTRDHQSVAIPPDRPAA